MCPVKTRRCVSRRTESKRGLVASILPTLTNTLSLPSSLDLSRVITDGNSSRSRPKSVGWLKMYMAVQNIVGTMFTRAPCSTTTKVAPSSVGGVAPLALNIGQLGGCFAYSGADWGGDRLVVSGIKVGGSHSRRATTSFAWSCLDRRSVRSVSEARPLTSPASNPLQTLSASRADFICFRFTIHTWLTSMYRQETHQC